MAAILGKAVQGYQILFDELTDPRTNGWFLVAKPYQTLTFLVLYLMFVLKWGPAWMKNRRPFNLDKILIVYNAFQIVSCMYIFVMGIYLAWGWHYKWFCEPIDFSNDPRAVEIAKTVYYYFLLKILDLLDTVFFVLRKKFNQVSFLHIYHHTGMVILIWAATTYMPGGHGTLIGVINSFVHVVMYSYYLLTVAFPSIKNAIWIKKHVTQLQILQFFWCVVHMAVIVFKTDCEFPRWTSAVFLPQNIFMLVLFTDFYIKTYIRKPRAQLKAQKNNHEITKQNNSSENNNAKTNSVSKINDVSNYINNDLNKFVNNHGNSAIYKNNNNNKELNGNTNKFDSENGKSSCAPGKCKINDNKQCKDD